MNNHIYQRTGAYRKLYSAFGLFFEEIRLTYGKEFCQEVKREALCNSLDLEDISKIDEMFILNRVNLRHPEIRMHMDEQTRMILGAVA